MTPKIKIGILNTLLLLTPPTVSAKTFQVDSGSNTGASTQLNGGSNAGASTQLNGGSNTGASTQLTAFADTFSIVPNTSSTISGNVTDNDQNGIAATLTSSPSGKYGYINFNGDGRFTYTLFTNSSAITNLQEGQILTDNFTYSYANSAGQSVNTSLSFQIIGIPSNQVGDPAAPLTALDDTATVIPGKISSISGNVTNNDSNGAFTRLTSAARSEFGNLIFNDDGSFTYTLNETASSITSLPIGAVRTDSFNYQYLNTQGKAVGASLHIRIINDPTQLIALPDTTTIINGKVSSVSGNVTNNDSNGKFTELISPASSDYGNLIFNNDGSYTYSLYANSPKLAALTQGQVVTDNFSYKYLNQAGKSVNSTLSIRIINDPIQLIAREDTAVIRPGSPLEVSGNVTDNDSNGTHVQLTSNKTSKYGTLIFADDGQYIYTVNVNSPDVLSIPAGGIVVDSFSYNYLNDTGGSVSSTLYIRLVNEASKLIALPDTATVTPNKTFKVSGNVTDNDSNGTSAQLTSKASSDYGYITFNETGAFTYSLFENATKVLALKPGEQVTDSFTYNYLDIEGNSKASTLTINIINNPIKIIALPDEATVIPRKISSVTGNVTDNDSNGNFARLTQPDKAISNFGSLVFKSDGSYTYTLFEDSPAVLTLPLGKVTIDSFEYIYLNSKGEVSAPTTLNIRIISNPSQLRARDDTFTILPGNNATVSGNVTTNDSNGDFVKLAPKTTALPAQLPTTQYGYINLKEDGSFAYTLYTNVAKVNALSGGQIIIDPFRYEYSDRAGNTVIATLNIQIIGNNVAGIIAQDDTVTIIQNKPAVVNGNVEVSGNVTSNDSNGSFVTLDTTSNPPASNYGFLILNQDGSFTYTLHKNSKAVTDLTAGQVVIDSFQYIYSNNEGASATALLKITIIGNPVNGDGNTIFKQPAASPFDNVDIEFNNRSDKATPVNRGHNIKGHLYNSSDKDWFRITTEGNEIISLKMCPQGTDCYNKKSWVMYVFDSDLIKKVITKDVYGNPIYTTNGAFDYKYGGANAPLIEQMENQNITLNRWADKTGSNTDINGNIMFRNLSTPSKFILNTELILKTDPALYKASDVHPVKINESNHLYLAYNYGYFEGALIGIIDPCYDASNTVEIGIPLNILNANQGPFKPKPGASTGTHDYFIAVSSPLARDQADCNKGSVVLKRPGPGAAGLDAFGKAATYATTEEYITAFPNSDDQYTINVDIIQKNNTPIPPLLSPAEQLKLPGFSTVTKSLIIPKVRVLDKLYSTNLTQLPSSRSANNTLRFAIASIEQLSPEVLADTYQATYNPDNNRVVLPRVAIDNTNQMYSVILQYYPKTDNSPAWLDIIAAELIQQ